MSALLLPRLLKTVVAFWRMVCCGLLLAAVIAPSLLNAQTPEAKVGVFPEKLLDGTGDFDLALTLQGDLRGNYGPCG